MKKKGLLIVGIIILVLGGIVGGMALTGGGATEEDQKTGEQVDQELDAISEEDLKMPEADAEAEAIEDQVDLGEFDPNDI